MSFPGARGTSPPPGLPGAPPAPPTRRQARGAALGPEEEALLGDGRGLQRALPRAAGRGAGNESTALRSHMDGAAGAAAPGAGCGRP